MLAIDLSGKRALVAGVADDGGFGFAIAKSLAEAGASICLGTWPPALGIFTTMLARGKFDASLGCRRQEARVREGLPLDADFDALEDMPAELRESRRYREHGGRLDRRDRRAECAAISASSPLDIVVHSLANGPEVKKPLLETSRKGYLAAVGVSSYSYTSMVQRFGPLVRPGGSFVALTYMASERVIPGYGGGMSSAKAALESDTRTLAFEAGRKWGPPGQRHLGRALRLARPPPSASSTTCSTTRPGNAPLTRQLEAVDVGATAAFLASPLAAAITGATLYVDHGYHAMGMAVDRESPLHKG
jgi:enoyl-[acyl-carrier protein] reductase I